jgi:hypothetical protein
MAPPASRAPQLSWAPASSSAASNGPVICSWLSCGWAPAARADGPGGITAAGMTVAVRQGVYWVTPSLASVEVIMTSLTKSPREPSWHSSSLVVLDLWGKQSWEVCPEPGWHSALWRFQWCAEMLQNYKWISLIKKFKFKKMEYWLLENDQVTLKL